MGPHLLRLADTKCSWTLLSRNFGVDSIPVVAANHYEHAKKLKSPSQWEMQTSRFSRLRCQSYAQISDTRLILDRSLNAYQDSPHETSSATSSTFWVQTDVLSCRMFEPVEGLEVHYYQSTISYQQTWQSL